MFDLNEITTENIIFAMEDQTHCTVIDPETGEARKIDEMLDAHGQMVSPPLWTSSDGFNLMEGFLSTVRNPSARRELSAALSRGKGVFKAFKEALGAYPDVEKAFRDYKLRVIRKKIHEWYDDLREANGLSRLGHEPEETAELLSTDLGFRVVRLDAVADQVLALLAEAGGESCEALPSLVAECELERLREEVTSGRAGTCAVSDDDSGGVLACALGFVKRRGTRAYCSIEFLYVRPGFRRMGLGSAVLSLLVESMADEDVGFALIDSPLVPPDYASALAVRGYLSCGIRALAPRS